MNLEDATQLTRGQSTQLDPPEGITPQDWQALCASGTTVKLGLRRLLFLEGTAPLNVYILISGTAILKKSGKALDIVEPGDSIGAGLMQKNSQMIHYPVSCETITKCEFLQVPVEDLNRCLSQNPDLYFYFFKQVQKRMRFLQFLHQNKNLSVPKRLAQFLIEKEKCLKHHPVTRRVMAEILNTTSESIIRAFGEFYQSGHLTKRGRSFAVNEKLKQDFLSDGPN